MKIDKTFQVGDSPRVEIKTQSGEIRFLPHTEPGEVRVVAEARPDSGLDATVRGSTVVVATDRRSWFRSDDARVIVYVPPSTEAMINTASADVDVTTPLSRLVAHTASGDLRFEAVDDLDVKTASGDVKGRKVTESARVVSASGDVRIESCGGKANFSSASGDLEIYRCDASNVKASTASGDISVRLCQSNDVDCKSMSGSVSLGIPPRTRVNLDANTLSGDVRLPKPAKTAEQPESEMSVKVRLVSGDVNLYRSA